MSAMISNPENYFRSLVSRRDALLESLEKEAETNAIPIVGPMVGELLCLLASATRANAILELGTATGYSTIFLARAVEERGGRVETWEISVSSAQEAVNNIRKAGLESIVDVKIGNAVQEIGNISGTFDIIFIDIDKRDYAGLLPHCHRLLREGGLLIADNVGFADADSFNQAIFGSAGWCSVHLSGFFPGHSPEHDGLCLGLRL
jgi:caffeoyl-CoA O-methyltransferase